ncbi:MAG: amidohydrolase family protein [Rhodospirillales bacterium]
MTLAGGRRPAPGLFLLMTTASRKCIFGKIACAAPIAIGRRNCGVAEDGHFHMTVDGADFDVPGLDSHLGEGRPGMWDRDARLADMDAEGIDTSLFFHSRAMGLVRMEDKAFFTRCMDVYNEWLAEFCAPHPDRLVGVGILPTIYNPAASHDYLQKMQALGLKALEIPSAPKNVPYNASKMEPLWSAIEESGIPVMFHIGAYMEFRGAGATGANLTKNLGPHRPLWALLAFSGILERHPGLKVVFCEGRIWLGAVGPCRMPTGCTKPTVLN